MAKRDTGLLILLTVVAFSVITYIAVQSYNLVGNMEEANETGEVTEEPEPALNQTVQVQAGEVACTSDADCVLAAVACCDNNNVGQKSCVNPKSTDAIESRLKSQCGNEGLCPMFFVQSLWSCSCQGGRCATYWSSGNVNVSYVGSYS